jgi:hypothetical protein
MSELVDQLADEFVVCYRRGEDPDLRDYLGRAGDESEELARVVEVLLRAVPPPEPTPEAVALARAWVAEQEPPLLALRLERGLRREQVIDSLAQRLALAPTLREKLSLRYHELETGQLDPTRVDRRVWQALGATLRAKAEVLMTWTRPMPRPTAPVMFRAELAPAEAPPPLLDEPNEPDQVDQLFGLS